jgi:hypothetical protein
VVCDKNIARLLVVAGPSGCGKSAFISQLISGQLPSDVLLQLPLGVEGWPLLQANESRHSDFNVDGQSPGVIFHYDLCRLLYFGDFRRDVALRIIEMAQAVTIVHLKASAERLLAQLSHRETIKAHLRDHPPNQGVLQSVHHALRRTVIRVAWTRFRSFGTRETPSMLKIRKYADTQWVRSLHVQWESYLASALGDERSITELFLQPDPSSKPGHVHWRPAQPPSPVHAALAAAQPLRRH